MIKVKVNNEYKDVVKIFCGGTLQKEITKVWSREAQEYVYVYESSVEYTGTLPITISANGDALLDYRIYGADGGVGVATENLIDADNPGSQRVELEPNTDYCLCKYTGPSQGGIPSCYVYDENDNKLFGDYINVWVSYSFTNWHNGAYAIISFGDAAKGKLSFTKGRAYNTGSLYPETYIPYGYKLPLIFDGVNVMPTEFVPYAPSVSYDVPVYIGENQLDSVEGVSDYVDKASDKIVRMIGEYTFTGDESFNKYGNSDVFYTSKTIDPVGITTVNTITMRCNHPAFTAIENKDTRYWLNPEADNICCFLPGGMSQVFLRSTSNFTTATECKAYLKAQFDNGTPVKISYWLKPPVEEDPPVSFPDIPTIKGETVIDYDGEPKPSQMYVKYRR